MDFSCFVKKLASAINTGLSQVEFVKLVFDKILDEEGQLIISNCCGDDIFKKYWSGKVSIQGLAKKIVSHIDYEAFEDFISGFSDSVITNLYNIFSSELPPDIQKYDVPGKLSDLFVKILTEASIKPRRSSKNSAKQKTQPSFLHTDHAPTEGIRANNQQLVLSITHDQMWAAGKRWYVCSRQPGGRFFNLEICPSILPEASVEAQMRFPIHAHQSDGQNHPLEDMIRDTDGHLYLIGEGGIGKTTALFSIMERVYDPKNAVSHLEKTQVPLFIELSKAPDTYGRLYEGGASTFVHRAVYQLLRQDLKVKQIARASIEQMEEVFNLDPETAVRPIQDLFTHQENAPEYLLLLDGLNEVSRARIIHEKEPAMDDTVIGMVLREIKRMMDYPNVRIILTSRTMEEANWGDKITKLYLSGISTETVEQYLKERNTPEERVTETMQNDHLLHILRIPLFLTMFAAIEGDDLLLTRGEILNAFLNQKQERLYTQKSRNTEIDESVRNSAYSQNPDRLTADMQSFILDFILPEIAWRMVQTGEFHITRAFLGENEGGLDAIIANILSDESATAICGAFGCEVFKTYRSASRSGYSTADVANRMKEHLGNQMRKVIASILDSAVMMLGVMVSDGVEYSFIHHHIRDYFAAVYQINRLRMAVFLQSKKRGTLARECLTDWKEHPFQVEVCCFIGEILGEAHNQPVCDENGDWHYAVPTNPCDRNLIKRAFDLYRGRFDGQDGYAVWNLLEILKKVRDDLSGEDFSALDLTRCEVNGHTLGERKCVARLSGTMITEEFIIPQGHRMPLTSAAISPDGRRIITQSLDSTAKVWDLETQHLIATIGEQYNEEVLSANYSPNNCWIVVSFGKEAKVFDANTFNKIGSLDTDANCPWISNAIYSPNSDRIITYGGAVIRIWNADSFMPIITKRIDQELIGFKFACYSSDGNSIIVLFTNGTAAIWNAYDLTECRLLCEGFDHINLACLSPDGQRILVSSGDSSAKVINTTDWQVVGIINEWIDESNSACYSPKDGQFIVTKSDDIVKVWNATSLQEVGTLQTRTKGVISVSISQDDRYITTASFDGSVRVWDLHTLREEYILRVVNNQNAIHCACFSPDCQRILTASEDSTVKVWNTYNYRISGMLRGHSARVFTATYNKNGERIVTASYDGTAGIWDSKGLCRIDTLYSFPRPVYSAEFSPDGMRIVTVSWGGVVNVWKRSKEVFTKIETLNLDMTKSTRFAHFTPDGQQIITDGNRLLIWNVNSLKNPKEVIVPNEPVECPSISPTGRWIAIFSFGREGTIIDTKALEKIDKLDADAICFSPDGKRAVTIYNDGIVRIWEMEPFVVSKEIKNKEIMNTNFFTHYARFSQNGKSIITVSVTGMAKVWDAETFKCLHTIYNIPGLEVQGVDMRNLHPDSRLSDEIKERLYEYGAIVDERG